MKYFKILLAVCYCLLLTTIQAQKISNDLADLELHDTIQSVHIKFETSKNVNKHVITYFPVLTLDIKNKNIRSRTVSFSRDGKINMDSSPSSRRRDNSVRIEKKYGSTYGDLVEIQLFSQGTLYERHEVGYNTEHNHYPYRNRKDRLMSRYRIFDKDNEFRYYFDRKEEYESNLGYIHKIDITNEDYETSSFIIEYILDENSNWIEAHVYTYNSSFDHQKIKHSDLEDYLEKDYIEKIGDIKRDISYY